MNGVLGRTATHALGNASWPFIKTIAELGIEKATKKMPALGRGFYTYQGTTKHPSLLASRKGRK
jgi:alanine dehydrogenase